MNLQKINTFVYWFIIEYGTSLAGFCLLKLLLIYLPPPYSLSFKRIWIFRYIVCVIITNRQTQSQESSTKKNPPPNIIESEKKKSSRCGRVAIVPPNT